jgi:hypothetical protein
MCLEGDTTRRPAEPIEHLDDLGCPLLGQQIDLQIEMMGGKVPNAVVLRPVGVPKWPT